MAQSEERWATLRGFDAEGRRLSSDEFRVVVRTWFLTEGQPVYGIWMRRAIGCPDYDAERYYPVHPSRYRMDAVARQLGNSECWVMEWWIDLDGCTIMANAGDWQGASRGWELYALPGEPWVMFHRADRPSTEWHPDVPVWGGPGAWDAAVTVDGRPRSWFVPPAECDRSNGCWCAGALDTGIQCSHLFPWQGSQHAPVELGLWPPGDEEVRRLSGAYPRVFGTGTWPRGRRQGFVLAPEVRAAAEGVEAPPLQA